MNKQTVVAVCPAADDVVGIGITEPFLSSLDTDSHGHKRKRIHRRLRLRTDER